MSLARDDSVDSINSIYSDLTPSTVATSEPDHSFVKECHVRRRQQGELTRQEDMLVATSIRFGAAVAADKAAAQSKSRALSTLPVLPRPSSTRRRPTTTVRTGCRTRFRTLVAQGPTPRQCPRYACRRHHWRCASRLTFDLTWQIKAGRPLTAPKIQFLFQLARDNVDSVVTSLEGSYRFYEVGEAVERFYTAAYSLF